MMKCRAAVAAALVSVCLVSGAPGQDELSRPPFAEYPEPVVAYLQRIHARSGAADESNDGPPELRPDDPGGFVAWQADARRKLTELLGLDRMGQENSGHQPIVRLDDPVKQDGYVRRRGDIETEPGVTIPFWLLTPLEKPTSLLPLVVCAHGHDKDGWNTYAGVYRDQEHRSRTLARHADVGVQAVKRGFIALVPATRGLAAAVSIPDLKGRHGKRDCRAQLIHCLLAGRTAVGERVWDTRRVLDWALAELDEVDPARVVMLGNSGGGVLTVYVAALDERVSAAVPSCSFTSYTSRSGFIFHCDCCLVPRVQVELGDMADIGALTAPRPMLAVHGREDRLHSGPDVEAAMSRVRSIYSAAGAAHAFRHRWGDSGHRFYPELMWPFIETIVN